MSQNSIIPKSYNILKLGCFIILKFINIKKLNIEEILLNFKIIKCEKSVEF